MERVVSKLRERLANGFLSRPPRAKARIGRLEHRLRSAVDLAALDQIADQETHDPGDEQGGERLLSGKLNGLLRGLFAA